MLLWEKVSSSQTFRIKGIPSPSGTVRNEAGYVKMPKTSLEKVTVGVALLDFDFDFSLRSVRETIKELKILQNTTQII